MPRGLLHLPLGSFGVTTLSESMGSSSAGRRAAECVMEFCRMLAEAVGRLP